MRGRAKMSAAFLQVYVNLPIPRHGTLRSVVIASVVRYLPYGMRYAYAGVLRSMSTSMTLPPRLAPAALSSSCVSFFRSLRLH